MSENPTGIYTDNRASICYRNVEERARDIASELALRRNEIESALRHLFDLWKRKEQSYIGKEQIDSQELPCDIEIILVSLGIIQRVFKTTEEIEVRLPDGTSLC